MTKISRGVKLALAGLAALASSAAFAAGPTVNNGSNGTADLFLVVFDSNQSTSYVEDLGVTTAAIASNSAVDTLATNNVGGTVSAGTSYSTLTFTADSNLSSYLSTHSGDSFQWEVISGNQTSNNTATNFLLTTSPTAIPATFNGVSSGLQNSDVDSNALTFSGDVNSWKAVGFTAAPTVNANASDTGAFKTASQLPGGSSDPGPLTWWNTGAVKPAVTWSPASGTSSAAFYLEADSDTSPADATFNAAIFTEGTASLAANGTLTLSAVPLPAAVWLFGSGLLGLAGVARRRLTA